jgi:hypothetical protein
MALSDEAKIQLTAFVHWADSGGKMDILINDGPVNVIDKLFRSIHAQTTWAKNIYENRKEAEVFLGGLLGMA